MPRGPNGEQRPADPIACAVHVAKILTGEIEETIVAEKQEAKAAGGTARAAAMTAQERSEAARKAAQARWAQ